MILEYIFVCGNVEFFSLLQYIWFLCPIHMYIHAMNQKLIFNQVNKHRSEWLPLDQVEFIENTHKLW
jgi:hypothetical protein